MSPCVFVVRDSVGGRALPCPQQRRSEGRWQREHVQTCASKWGWLFGAHNEVGTDGPDLRVGGVCRGWGAVLMSVLGEEVFSVLLV